MLSVAKEFRCDFCPAVEIQTGPRAFGLLVTPPYGWAMVDTTRTLPPRAVEAQDGKVKMGETRNTVRKFYCPSCSSTLKY